MQSNSSGITAITELTFTSSRGTEGGTRHIFGATKTVSSERIIATVLVTFTIGTEVAKTSVEAFELIRWAIDRAGGIERKAGGEIRKGVVTLLLITLTDRNTWVTSTIVPAWC